MVKELLSREEEEVWKILENVFDPEIPVLTVVDLGVVRSVSVDGDKVQVEITPTYSGCPAMDTIEQDIRATLSSKGFREVEVSLILSPAWTTDWMSEVGKKKLEEYGIAPPAETSSSKRSLLGEQPIVRCPHCKSTETILVSQFGSTACKALYKCKECLEPFDYFKCL